MKKNPITAVLLLTLAFIVGCGYFSAVEKNNAAFGATVKTIEADEVTLNAIVPFEWEKMYTFTPYVSRERIAEIIGFDSDDLDETVSEGMEQLLFVNGTEVVASICGYSDNLGYSFNFGVFEEDYLVINKTDNAVFTVVDSSRIIALERAGL